jgi:hypothetical protein
MCFYSDREQKVTGENCLQCEAPTPLGKWNVFFLLPFIPLLSLGGDGDDQACQGGNVYLTVVCVCVCQCVILYVLQGGDDTLNYSLHGGGQQPTQTDEVIEFKLPVCVYVCVFSPCQLCSCPPAAISPGTALWQFRGSRGKEIMENANTSPAATSLWYSTLTRPFIRDTHLVLGRTRLCLQISLKFSGGMYYCLFFAPFWRNPRHCCVWKVQEGSHFWFWIRRSWHRRSCHAQSCLGHSFCPF